VLTVRPVLAVGGPGRWPYGRLVRLSATAALPGGAPAGGVPVTVQWRGAGDQGWTTLASGRTGPGGALSFTVRPTATGRLRAVAAAAPGQPRAGQDSPQSPGGYSAAASPTRTAVVTVTGALGVAARHRDRYVLRLARTPAPAGTRFLVQERRRGRWTTLHTVTGLPRTASPRRLRGVDRQFRVVPAVASPLQAVPSATVRVPRR
jgi:hypothetical protein